MADELHMSSPSSPGITNFYAVIFPYAGRNVVKASDGSIIPISSSNWPLAVIPLDDTNSPGEYYGSIPQSMPTGRYSWAPYQGSGAISDSSQGDSEWFDWNGTAQPVTPVVDPTGYYASRSGIAGIIGDSNVVLWSQLETQDAPTDVDTVILQSVLNRVDNYFNRRLREIGYVAPLATTSADFAYLQDLANQKAAVFLYRGRPETMTDPGEDVAGRMRNMDQDVEESLDELLMLGIDGAKLDPSGGGISIVSAPTPIYPFVPFSF
jgi:hypothetical protein